MPSPSPDLSPGITEPVPPASTLPDSSQPKRASPSPVVEGFLLLLLIIVAVGFRASRFPAESTAHPGITTVGTPDQADPLSMDELWHLTLSTGRGSPFYAQPRDMLVHDTPAWTSMDGAKPWWAVWTNMRDATHPPLYVLTLRLWRNAFGGSDTAALCCSVAWSCVTIVFVFLAVRLAANWTAAFWAGAVLAVSPVSAYFGLEIRGYAMLTAEAAIALWLMVRLTLHGSRWRDVIGLCGVLLACMLTHYFSVLACLSAGTYAIAIAGRRRPGVLLAGAVTGAVYAAVWLPFALQQLHFAREGVGFLRTEDRALAYLSWLAAALPVRLLGETWVWPPLSVTSSLGIVVFAAVVVTAVKRPAARPFVVWYLGVVGFLLAADMAFQTQQVAFIRYPGAAQPAAAAFVPLIAALLVRKRWSVHVAGGAMCVLVMVMQPSVIHNDAPTFTPSLTPFVDRMKPDDVLLLSAVMGPGETEYTTDAILLDFAHVPKLFPRDTAILYKPISPELAAQLRGRRAWLLTLSAVAPEPVFTPGARVVERIDYRNNIVAPAPCKAFLLEFPEAISTTAPSDKR